MDMLCSYESLVWYMNIHGLDLVKCGLDLVKCGLDLVGSCIVDSSMGKFC